MLRQIKWGVQNGPSQTASFFENSISTQEPLING